MGYSRWTYSWWYTFWAARPHDEAEPENRDNALFEICDVAQFEAKRLRDDLPGCLRDVERESLGFTEDLREELLGYIREFLRDVDDQYGGKLP